MIQQLNHTVHYIYLAKVPAVSCNKSRLVTTGSNRIFCNGNLKVLDMLHTCNIHTLNKEKCEKIHDNNLTTYSKI